MAFKTFWIMGYRDLVRNKRRTILTLVAITLGLTLSIFMSGLIGGVMESSLRDSIRLTTGHIQLRAESYEEIKVSLLRRDLLDEPDALAAQAEMLPEVQAASPILWAGGVLGTVRESTAIRINGIDPGSSLHDPLRESLAAGEFLSADGRGEILMGQLLAREMDLQVGDRVFLAVGNPDGAPEEGVFTIVGLVNSGFPGLDNTNVFLNLSQAQSITHVGNRASTVRIMLHRLDDTAAATSALEFPGIAVLGWPELHEVLLTALETGLIFYDFLYAIIFLVVAVIIANTLLMSVFERTREMGILAALGMKGRQIMTMFLFEAVILGFIGSILGGILGSILVYYFSVTGIYIGEGSASAVQGMAIGTSMFTALNPTDILSLSLWMMIVILLVSLYPAWYAARMEPVEALHAL